MSNIALYFQMEIKPSKGITYYAELNDDGLMTYPKEHIFQIMADDKIIFHINSGSPIGRKSFLRINQARLGEDNLYHKSAITLNTLKKRPSLAKMVDLSEQDLARIEPKIMPFGGIEFEVEFPHPGSYFYQIEYFDSNLMTTNFTRPDWIVVHPKFITRNGEITAKSIVMQSVFCRCLGKLKDWPKVFESQAKIGYNAVHFVPMQKYGISGSLYSLKDQLSVDDWYVDNPSMPTEERLELLKNSINEIRERHNMLCFVDIVLNHTAVNSEWLVDHPDAGYNLHNCPFLKVAWLFDKFLAEFSEAYAQKKVAECPSAPYISNESDLQSVIKALSGRIKTLPLCNYFMYNKALIKTKFDEFLKSVDTNIVNELKAAKVDIMEYIMKHSYNYGCKENGVELDIEKICAIIIAKSQKGKNPADLWKDLSGYLDKCNDIWKNKYAGFMAEALKNLEDGIRYEKLTMKNPKITPDNMLVRRYFTQLKGNSSTRDPDEYIVAHNGWTMASDDFAVPMGFHYLRRVVVIWDDSVKLYYGKRKEDSPYLWSHMEKYVKNMASIFQGMRIDNCHSTPIHVLEYFVNYARSINPSLFVFAELFSGKAEIDAIYARRIGLNAMIRESIYCNSANDLAGNIWMNYVDQGKSIAAWSGENYLPDGRKIHILSSSKPKALLYDITHDNEGPMDRWNPQAILPLVSALSMANGSIGTTRGVDELYTKNLSVIAEKRLYAQPKDISLPNDFNSREIHRMVPQIPPTAFTFICEASRVSVAGSFNGWNTEANTMQNSGGNMWRCEILLGPGKHFYKFVVNGNDWRLGQGSKERDAKGYENNVVVVDELRQSVPEAAGAMQIHEDLRAVRKTLNDVHILLGKHKTSLSVEAIDDIIVMRRVIEDIGPEDESSYVLIARTNFNKGGYGMAGEAISKAINLPGKLSRVILTANMYIDYENVKKFAQNPNFVTGVKGQIYYHVNGSGLKHFAKIKPEGECDSLEFFKMPPSLCIIVTTKFSTRQTKIMSELHEINDPPVEDLSMSAINHMLFRCDSEEDEFSKRGIYKFDTITPKYAGLAGLMYEFNKSKRVANSCKCIYDNIINGNWLIDHILRRSRDMPELQRISLWLEKYLAPVKELTPSLKPKYFVSVISKLYYSIWAEVLKIAPPIFRNDPFTSQLILSTYQFMGAVPSSAYRNFKETMSAGLPHFAREYMRCWGRDTFIALRGLLLIPKRLQEARNILLMFAAVTRHGLIPNLHDKGNNTRFNARDATWFFMEALQEYVKHDTGNGSSIFQEKVELQFLDNNQGEHFRKLAANEKRIVTIAEIVQNIMESHANGINFVEWNEGTKIDEHMTHEGFRIKITMDPHTGFIYGGNKFNCGTWMDKMGSSMKAKNKGIPATPRDGADVEIIGLLRSACRFLYQAYEHGVYPYEGVKIETGTLTYKQWVFYNTTIKK